MVIWKIIDNKEDWDDCLLLMDLKSYLQTWEWGQHRSNFGWKPIRFVAYSNGKPEVMTQILLRSFPMRIGIVWIPGGPIGNVNKWSDSLLNTIQELTGLDHIVLKINDSRLSTQDDILILNKTGWKKSSIPLSTGLSLLWDLKHPYDVRRAALTSNWRHNLNRANKKGLKFELWDKPDIAEIFSLYQEMEEIKSLSQQFSFDEIKSIVNIFNKHLILFRCVDKYENTVAIRGCILYGSWAWDIIAAAGSYARKTYATYGTLWALAQECHLRGVTCYDLGGVDPELNKGVWNFKKGTGAKLVEFLGEWEITTSVILERCVNLAISMKGIN